MNAETLRQIYERHCGHGAWSGDKGTAHSYIDLYALWLEEFRNRPCVLLEIGVAEGKSLAMWREYLPHAEIIGVDIVDRALDIRGCRVIIGDATLGGTYDALDRLDIVIDDGSHSLGSQIAAFHLLFPRLLPGGVYVIEDVQCIEDAHHALAQLHTSARVYDLRHIKNRMDDICVIYRHW